MNGLQQRADNSQDLGYNQDGISIVWGIASLETNIRIRGRGSYNEDRQGDVPSTANTNIVIIISYIYALI